MQRSLPGASPRAVALRWLAQREQSRQELRRKLARRFPQEPPEVLDALLDRLAADGLLSDERFIESRIHARRAGFGGRRIAAEIGLHGLSVPAEARVALAATEFDRARAVWERRWGAPAADAAGRLRQQRFLLARGFDAEVIRRVVPREAAPAPGDADVGAGIGGPTDDPA